MVGLSFTTGPESAKFKSLRLWGKNSAGRKPDRCTGNERWARNLSRELLLFTGQFCYKQKSGAERSRCVVRCTSGKSLLRPDCWSQSALNRTSIGLISSGNLSLDLARTYSLCQWSMRLSALWPSFFILAALNLRVAECVPAELRKFFRSLRLSDTCYE